MTDLITRSSGVVYYYTKGYPAEHGAVAAGATEGYPAGHAQQQPRRSL
ncbi:MAG: hypothetical protein JWR35_3811 [Marmoricola sp.]|nr:hypothetical protein [Marmoricola sp.]